MSMQRILELAEQAAFDKWCDLNKRLEEFPESKFLKDWYEEVNDELTKIHQLQKQLH